MWALHQMHHSSEEYNLSTALRQGALQRYPSMVIVYLQFMTVSSFLHVLPKYGCTLVNITIQHVAIVMHLGALPCHKACACLATPIPCHAWLHAK